MRLSEDVFPDTTEQYRFHRRISLNVASRHSGFATPEMQILGIFGGGAVENPSQDDSDAMRSPKKQCRSMSV